MRKRRRNKRIGFGLTNLVLALAVVIATFVVTQTSALQYLKGKLAGGNVSGLMSVGHVSKSGSAAKDNDKELNVTLTKAVKSKMKNGMMLEKTGYVSFFNYDRNTPAWVAWELTAAKLRGNLSRKDYFFVPDEKLPIMNRVATYDYKETGYDKGHMCPAGDMKWSAAAMRDCFFLSNVCPQVPELNQRAWERLESACRRWASKMGRIYIVCGPIYRSKSPKLIGVDHKVAVPDGFFKVVVSLNKGNEKGIAFYYDNTYEKQTMTSAVRSIDQIEDMTKFDFFSELPNDVESRIESNMDLNAFGRDNR